MPVYQIAYKTIGTAKSNDEALLEYLNSNPNFNNKFGKHSIEIYSGLWLILSSSPIDVVQETLEDIAGENIIISVTELYKNSYRLILNNSKSTEVISWLGWHPCRENIDTTV